MSTVGILQACVGSTRLPHKALLPISGVPAAVLAVRRAANRELPIVLATSRDRSDDILAALAETAGIQVFRGARHDTLGRFAAVTAGYDADTVIIRLTGDNVYPDGVFLEAMLRRFAQSDVAYLGTCSPRDGLPYGMSAEIMRLDALRHAAAEAIHPLDREHVTPWIQRNCQTAFFDDFAKEVRLGHLRCTIDTFDDYARACRVFAGVKDPIRVGWRELCWRLAELPDAPRFTIPQVKVSGVLHGRMAMGTAQLGMEYGATNVSGMPSTETAIRMVRRAIEWGVTHFDTARAYGQSEARIGLALSDGWASRAHVITKLSLEGVTDHTPPQAIADAVDASVFRSCRELGVSRIDTLLLHRAGHLTAARSMIWEHICALHEAAVISRLGVSVENPDEAQMALNVERVQHIQLPFNLLDWRWRSPDLVERLAERPDVVVHARSVLLQGVLGLTAPEKWPAVAGVDAAKLISRLASLARRLRRSDVIDLCVAYALGQSWIHGLVLGMETLEQLDRDLELLTKPPLSASECALVEAELPRVPVEFLTPAHWPQRP